MRGKLEAYFLQTESLYTKLTSDISPLKSMVLLGKGNLVLLLCFLLILEETACFHIAGQETLCED